MTKITSNMVSGAQQKVVVRTVLTGTNDKLSGCKSDMVVKGSRLDMLDNGFDES